MRPTLLSFAPGPMSTDRVYQNFYRIPRLAASELSDNGGPFGFDIHTAIDVDFLIERYQCDAIVECGSNMGDTTHYLAQCYPQLAVLTCDIVPRYVNFVRERLAGFPNVAVDLCDSAELIAKVQPHFKRPLFYLDAHWNEDWPLEREINTIERGAVVVDDFDIGDPRFGFDEYNGVRCGPEFLRRFAERIPTYYTNNPRVAYEVPCLQEGRRAGRAYFQLGLEVDYMRFCRYFARRQNQGAGAPAGSPP